MHLGNPRARELFLELVKKSDVVVDNLTPGKLAQWGLSYRELKDVNSKIIQLHVSGYGSWGPWTGRTSYDAVAQSMGGLSSITGFEERGPSKSGVWIADWVTGLMCATSIVAALNHRAKTGEGQFIDYMQVENVIRFLDWTWLYSFKTGENRKRAGNRDLAICPSDLFECSDGWIALAAFEEKEFKALCSAMKQAGLYRKYADPTKRLKDENAKEILDRIARWTKMKRVKQVEELGNKHGFAASPVVAAKDAYESAHLRERGAIQEYDDALYGQFAQPCYPPRMSETPSRLKWSSRPLGFDNAYVLTQVLGLAPEEVKKLEEDKIVFNWNPQIASHCPPPDWNGASGLRHRAAVGRGQHG